MPHPAYTTFHASHVRRITPIVAPVMILELALAAWLTLASDPRSTWGLWPWAGLLAVAGIWLSTAAVQIPCHRALERGYDPDIHRRLVASNWARTTLWTFRLALATWFATTA